jgi:hypothetical protein
MGRADVNKEVEPNFSQYVSALMVEVVRMFEYFTGFPDEARLSTLTLPASSGDYGSIQTSPLLQV